MLKNAKICDSFVWIEEASHGKKQGQEKGPGQKSASKNLKTKKKGKKG